jgi:LPS O-antigen subunit length determinant protein (WzzB/FepE family)
MSDIKPEGGVQERLVYVMPQAQPEMAMDDEIDLFELWETIWSGKVLIAAITAVFTFGGIGYALLAQEWWKADVVLSPVEEQSGMSSTLARFGGLAALAGVDIGAGGGTEPLAVLKSKEFAREFITDFDLMPVLFEGVEASEDKPLDMRDAVRMFDSSIRTVTDDKKTGLVTISIRWKDPETAAAWANELVKRLNERMRRQALEQAERNVAYLQKEIATATVISLQQSMGRVLEGEMQKLMLARGNEEFAFKVIDRAVPPKERDAPKRALIAIMSLLVGGFLGVLVVFLRKAIANRPDRAQS